MWSIPYVPRYPTDLSVGNSFSLEEGERSSQVNGQTGFREPCVPSTPALRREEKRPERSGERGSAGLWIPAQERSSLRARRPGPLGDQGRQAPSRRHQGQMKLEPPNDLAAGAGLRQPDSSPRRWEGSKQFERNKLDRWKVSSPSQLLGHSEGFVGQHGAPAWHCWAVIELVAITSLVPITLLFLLLVTQERKGCVSLAVFFSPPVKSTEPLALLWAMLASLQGGSNKENPGGLAALWEAAGRRRMIRKSKERLWFFRLTNSVFSPFETPQTNSLTFFPSHLLFFHFAQIHPFQLRRGEVTCSGPVLKLPCNWLDRAPGTLAPVTSHCLPSLLFMETHSVQSINTNHWEKPGHSVSYSSSPFLNPLHTQNICLKQ